MLLQPKKSHKFLPHCLVALIVIHDSEMEAAGPTRHLNFEVQLVVHLPIVILLLVEFVVRDTSHVGLEVNELLNAYAEIA